MKSIRCRLFVLLFLFIGFQSCNLFPEPRQPDYKSELETLLPATQYLIAYFSGTDLVRFPLIWMQQQAGVKGVHLAVDRYNMQNDHGQEVWNFYYRNIFPYLYTISSNAEKINSKSYRGIARILTAYSIGLMTDAWGNIPNLSALDYVKGFLPPYDEQSDIYLYFLDLLNKGINDLTEATAASETKPGENHDLIYGGNLERWIKAANALKLRYTLRLAHQAGNYELVLPYLNLPLFTGNHEDMGYYFHSNQQNPFFFYDNTIRNTRMGKFFVEKLLAKNDPRLEVFVRRSTENNQFIGSAPGEANFNASFIGTTIAAEKAPVFFITYVEQKFIEAEIYHRTGQQTHAAQAFEQAVRASLQKFGVSNPVWENEHAVAENVSLEKIINAKYIALFLNPEVWSDYRRTGFPQLTPYPIDSEEITPKIPRRFVYPTFEIMYNSANVPANVTIFSRVWWDVIH